MKYLFSLLVLLIGASMAWVVYRSEPAPAQRAAAERVSPRPRTPVGRLAQTAEAGHVDEVLRWGSGPVAKGDLLVRLSVPVSTLAQRHEQQALRLAAAAYLRQPSAPHAQELARIRARLAAIPGYVRTVYVVAPVSGWLRGTAVVSGQYLPQAATVGIIDVPARTKPRVVAAAGH